MGSFNISSLAGTVFTGRTGFGAALHHAPQDEEGLERYVIFCGPHIAIDKDGQVGKVVRRGRASLSTACGALIAFEAELKSGRVNTNDKPLDVEYCNLKRRLLAGIDFGKPAPGLAGLTGVCQETTVEVWTAPFTHPWVRPPSSPAHLHCVGRPRYPGPASGHRACPLRHRVGRARARPCLLALLRADAYRGDQAARQTKGRAARAPPRAPRGVRTPTRIGHISLHQPEQTLRGHAY